MTVPVITERTPAVDQSNEGYVAVREFTIIATSEENAKALLLANKSITLGTVYQSPYSETPDADAIALNIAVRGSPPAPSTGGGATGLYIVTVRYGRPALNGQLVQPELAGPAVWRKQRSLVSLPVDIDLNDNPVTNKADEPFDPPVMVEQVEVVVTATFIREHSTWLAADLFYEGYVGKINDVPYIGAAAGCLLCILANPVEIQPGLFKIEMAWKYRAPFTRAGTVYEGWQSVILNRGRRIRAGSYLSGAPRYINLEDGGVPVVEPVALNATGDDRLPAGDPPTVVVFDFYERIDFNALGIV